MRTIVKQTESPIFLYCFKSISFPSQADGQCASLILIYWLKFFENLQCVDDVIGTRNTKRNKNYLLS